MSYLSVEQTQTSTRNTQFLKLGEPAYIEYHVMLKSLFYSGFIPIRNRNEDKICLHLFSFLQRGLCPGISCELIR